jgi:hypothetical protein
MTKRWLRSLSLVVEHLFALRKKLRKKRERLVAALNTRVKRLNIIRNIKQNCFNL